MRACVRACECLFIMCTSTYVLSNGINLPFSHGLLQTGSGNEPMFVPG